MKKLLREYDVSSRILGKEKFRIMLNEKGSKWRIDVFRHHGERADRVGELMGRKRKDTLEVRSCNVEPFVRMRKLGKASLNLLKEKAAEEGVKKVRICDVINPFLLEKYRGQYPKLPRKDNLDGSVKPDFEFPLTAPSSPIEVQPLEKQLASFLKKSFELRGKSASEKEITELADDILTRAEEGRFKSEESKDLFLFRESAFTAPEDKEKAKYLSETGWAFLTFLEKGKKKVHLFPIGW